MQPEVKKAGKEQIKEKARESIREKLAKGRLNADRDNREQMCIRDRLAGRPADRKQVYHAGRMAPQQRTGGNHYDTEYER